MNYGHSKIIVLIAINDFLMGGAQRVTADLLEYLDTDRYELHLLILAAFPDRPSFHSAIPPHVTVHQLSMSSLLSLRGWREVFGVIRRVRPQVILSNLYFANTVTRIAALFSNIPVIAVEHNTYTTKNALQHSIDWALSHVTFRIVAVSKAVADYVIAHQRIRRHKVTVIPNGIDLSVLKRNLPTESKQELRAKVGIGSDEHVVLHVGRLVPQKDPELLIRGYALFVANHRASSRLIVVGGGECRAAVTRLAKELNIEDRVLFTGAAAPARYYAMSDVFISTSRIEGFGLVRAEALWYGLPVVTTLTGGTEELIQEGSTGSIVSEPTDSEIAEGIERCFAMDRTLVAGKARQTAERFSTEIMGQRYESLLRSAIKGI
jgi:glycosyltransferase involved in cell wall biosynthesis